MVKTRLSCTESALILRELYCDNFSPPVPDNINACLGAISRRINSEPVIGPMIRATLRDYVTHEVKDVLGMSYVEYINTPQLVRGEYNTFLLDVQTEKNAAYDELEEIKRQMAEAGKNGS